MSGYVMSYTCSKSHKTTGGKCFALPSKCNDNSLKINPLTRQYEWLCNEHWTQECKARRWDENLTNAVNHKSTITKLLAESLNKRKKLEMQLDVEENRCASLSIAFNNTTEYSNEEMRFRNLSSGENISHNSTSKENVVMNPLLSSFSFDVFGKPKSLFGFDSSYIPKPDTSFTVETPKPTTDIETPNLASIFPQNLKRKHPVTDEDTSYVAAKRRHLNPNDECNIS